MLRCSYFLWVFTVCRLWGSQAQFQPIMTQSILDHIASHQHQWFTYTAQVQGETQAKIDRMKAELAGQLNALQVKTDSQHKSLQDTVKSRKTEIGHRPINQVFKKYGSRYFYIERQERLNWFQAFNKCRRLGGYLATFNDLEELQKVNKDTPIGAFWLDATSLAKKGVFLSTRTGESPPYFRWADKRPTNNENECVNLYVGKMWSPNCWDEYLSICQSDQ
ncbi:accessory gland protein Acp29AB-like isoform X1 [Drosophila ficusphila]|uniref:accessory gland protein Acp29AB-like isoform X1 n=1 Tax=Drosophila ficusphila TaxID=30025 RepID=UPI0007E87EAE|nr:accessory gland protein Acp29AB-like isoform X1 [Drosophila ficusphila]